MRTLRDVVKWLEEAEQSEVSMKTVCLRAPCAVDGRCGARVVELDEESRLPQDATLSDGLRYFLETSVARCATDRQNRRLRTHAGYFSTTAENDAYSAWVYK